MTLTRKKFFICLGVLALISAVPLVQVVIVFPLLIIGAFSVAYVIVTVSVLSNTFLLYSLPLLPTLKPWQGIPNHLLRALLSVALISIIAFLVPAISEYKLNAFIAEKEAARLSNWAPTKIRSIALVSNNPVYAALSRPFRVGCSPICQALLYHYEVEKVVVVLPPRTSNERLLTTSYRIERQAGCKDVAADKPWLVPKVHARIIAGECLVGADVDDQETVDATVADVTLRGGVGYLNEDLQWDHSPWSWFSNIERLRIIAVYVGGRRTGKPVLRQYEIEGWAYTAPLHFLREERDCVLCMAVLAKRKQGNTISADLESILQTKLSLKVDRRSL
jgi:hypothetical protein